MSERFRAIERAISGSARSNTAVTSRNRHTSRSPERSSIRKAFVSIGAHTSGALRCSPNQSSNDMPGRVFGSNPAIRNAIGTVADTGGTPRRRASPSATSIQPSTGSGIASPSSADESVPAVRPIRSRSSGGVITVVTSTTTSSAPYRSLSSTPLVRPMLAKINPTSPRGIMPSPISSLSVRVPNAPNAAATLPRMPITVSTAASPSTLGFIIAPMSALMPICTKNTGIKMLPMAPKSRVIRS